MTTTDPHSDAWSRPAPAPHFPDRAPAKRVPWPDGRIYNHTDGTFCGAGQNQTMVTLKEPYPAPEEWVAMCTTHQEEIVLAPRFRHEDDGEDCEADEGQVTQYPGEARRCTLHETPVEQVW